MEYLNFRIIKCFDVRPFQEMHYTNKEHCPIISDNANFAISRLIDMAFETLFKELLETLRSNLLRKSFTEKGLKRHRVLFPI